MLLQTGRPDTPSVALDDIPWATDPATGYGSKLVRVSLATNSYTALVRWGPEMRVPTHVHSGEVHAYTYSGAWAYQEYDWVAREGSYVYEPPGVIHTLTILEDDTVVLFVVNGAHVDLGPDGEPIRYTDAASALEIYRQRYAENGIEFPENVLFT